MKTNNLDSLLVKVGYFDRSEKIREDIKKISLVEKLKIKEKIDRCIYFDDIPSSFLITHDSCWNEHNSFDEELTSKQKRLPILFNNLNGLNIVEGLFEISIGLDRAKRIVSNSVKQVIENYSISKKMNPSEINLLFTSLTEPFYIQYARDIRELDDYSLAKKYFRGSLKIASLERSSSKNFLPANYPSEEDWKNLNRRIILHEKTILAQKYGLEVFAIDQLLERDHFQEYTYRTSLVGIGDYYLHQLVSEVTGIPIENFDDNLKKLKRIKKRKENTSESFQDLSLLSQRFKERYNKLIKGKTYLSVNNPPFNP